MNERSAAVELTEDELTAIGLVLTMWRAETQGLTMPQIIGLAMAMEETDHGVLRALIDRVVLKMSVVEDEIFNKTEHIPDMPELRDHRARMFAHLDQIFARFEEEGRVLFP